MKKTRLLAMMLACIMILSACTPSAPVDDKPKDPVTPPVTDKPTEPTKPVENAYTGPKDYRGWSTTMATFNPQMYTNSKMFMNYGTFVAMVAKKDGSSELDFVPHHASELPKSTDGGTTWTIKIRDGLEWTDGTPIDAKTYDYTFKMLLDPKLANKNAVYTFDTCIIKGAKDYYAGKGKWEDVGVKLVND